MYEIYPIPQEIRYLDEVLETDNKFNLILDENIDKYNLEKIENIYKEYLNNDKDNTNNIDIKINNNKEFEKFDQYSIKIDKDKIQILYKDNYSLYYALVTLEKILEQSKNKIKCLEIEDYADVKYRGIIEGFYGVPWSWENKKELLKFGSKLKNNVFIYAPKDDPYHRDKWRDFYPKEDIKKLREIAELGAKYKNRFVYTIAPFKKESNPINNENFDKSIKQLEEKLNQLYEIGIRQFGILADDVGKVDYNIVVDVVNKIDEWKNKKEDVFDLLFCPGSYVLTWAWDSKELNAYNLGFSKDVQIFFTGRNTCSPIDQKDIEELKNKEISEEYGGDGSLRRDPMFWLNWPVNDIDTNYRKLYLGKAVMLNKDVKNLVGVVTNPMQEANASKVSIFSVSNYSWNIDDFDNEKTWKDSFKYIDRFAHEELNEIAKHMSNQDDKGIKNLEESNDLIDLEKRFNESMDLMLVSEFKEVLKLLKNKFKNLIDTIDLYFLKSKEEKLKEEVRPYFNALRDLLNSGIYFIESFMALEEGQKEIGLKLYNIGCELFEKYSYYPIKSEPNSNRFMKMSETSTLRIKPIILRLKKYMDRPFERKSDLSNEQKLFFRGMDNSKSYRIPALLNTDKDTLLAFSDKRNEHQFDWGNIDLVVRRKEKNDNKFSDNQVIIDPVDRDGGKMPEDAIWPVDLDIGDKSAFVIDPCVVQSNKTGRIFSLVTFFPQSKGFFSIKNTGNGYIKIDNKQYLKLSDKDGNFYYLKDDKVYSYYDNSKTDFKVIIEDKDQFRSGDILDSNNKIIGNIYLENDYLNIDKTSHIYMTYSDDDGNTWSTPRSLNKEIKAGWMKFMGVAPGRGICLKSGRVLIPTYFTNKFDKQSSCFIYTDDNGQTWKRGESINKNREIENPKLSIDDKDDFNYFYQAGESQAVELNNGIVKLFLRNNFYHKPRYIQVATSYDGGETFDNKIEDLEFKVQSLCQLSAIHINYNNREFVLISAPSSYDTFERLNGRIYLLEVNDTKLKYLYSKYISYGMFWYSSIELVGDEIYIAYEGGETLHHNDMDIMYRKFNLKYIFNEVEIMRYEIYPKVKNILYKSRSTYLDSNINLSFDEKIDIYNKDELRNILINNDFNIENEIYEDNIKINLEIDNSLKEIDEYIIDVEEHIISIKGKDNNSIFYALKTLEQILDQNKKFIRNIRIEDYADQKIRGIIEGYYGIPYNWETRKDLMKFGSKFKANSFVYAPKDDPYHRERWDELYPKKESESIKDIAKLSKEIKMRFIWTISPFKKESNPISKDNYDESIKKLLSKLDQIYDLGVRQFGVLGDDVGALEKDVVVRVMNDVSKWAKKQDETVYDFVFVPEGYVLADWGFRPDELDLYSKEFPEDIQIMFTGDNTCAPITQSSINDFKNRDSKIGERRDPLFWLNWPVNDIDRVEYRRIFMGKGEMLERGVRDLIGTLTNPLEEGYASMVALFAIADFSWNTDEFDSEKSWIDSFKYIEKNCPNELHEIAKHMSNTNGSGTNNDNGGILDLEESEELKKYIDEFEEKYNDNIPDNDIHPLYMLKEKYENIVHSIDTYLEDAYNINLKKEIKPYVKNLRYKSLACIEYINGLLEVSNNNIELAKLYYEKGTELLNKSNTYYVMTKTSEFDAKKLRAESGTLRINKNIKNIKNYLETQLN